MNNRQILSNKQHTEIIYLTQNYNLSDFIECRKERDWETFDKMNDAIKLMIRINEIKEYNRSNPRLKPSNSPDGYMDSIWSLYRKRIDTLS